MPHIVSTEEQMLTMGTAGSPVEVLGPGSEPLGCLTIFSPEERQAIARFERSNGTREPSVSGERVQAFLQKLYETADREGIDQLKVKELLRRLRAGER
jgi:hypothetical protein